MHQIPNASCFFDARDTIFQNIEEIYTYFPHDEIKNLAAFYSDNDFGIEYDYRFQTNNIIHHDLPEECEEQHETADSCRGRRSR